MQKLKDGVNMHLVKSRSLVIVLVIFISSAVHAGREVRMVPERWSHPTDTNGYYVPLFNGESYQDEIREWDEANKKWSQGLTSDFEGGWEPIGKEDKKLSYVEYDGLRPIKDDYMPNWTASKNTQYIMYETTTEGTPISPAFSTPEKLAKWLAVNKASAFANRTATYEEWLSMIKSMKSVPSAVTSSDGVKSGVEALSDKQNLKQ